jgi:hypothetical protein
MKCLTVAIAAFALLIPSLDRSVAQESRTFARVWKVTSFVPEGESIVGVWKVKSVVRKELVTGKRTLPYGEKPGGHLINTSGGHTSHLFIATDRKTPAGIVADGDQRLSAAFGTYQISGDKFVFYVDEAADPSLVGQTQTYKVDIEGQALSMVTTIRNPAGEFEILSTYLRDE